jgi:lysozyme
MNRELLIQELRADEGEKLRAYRDHLGYWTIGVGHLIDPARGANPAPFGADLRTGGGGTITPAQSAQLLAQDIDAKAAELDRRAPWWRGLSENRQRVVLNMAFQLGVSGVLAFRKAVAAMQVGDYDEAAFQMADSSWANTQTPARAARLIARMRAG